MSPDTNALILGTRKGLIIMDRDGSSWKVRNLSFAGAAIPYATVDPRTGVVWACVGHGHWGSKLHRSHDGGTTWEEIPAPTYPEGAEITAGVPATLQYLWVLAPGGEDQPERLYIGTEPGGLFRSDDGGDTWKLVESLWNHPSRLAGWWFGGGRDNPGIHSIIVDPRDSRRIKIAVSCAGVFESTDDGETWNPQNKGLSADFLPNPDAEVGQDPHFVTSSSSDPDVLWQQNHCGIFRSTNGGASWTKISQQDGPANFGFAIAADGDPETAWVVPAHSDEQRMAIDGALCVCRTDDGGATWQTYREGLPQEGSYDVVFRHALDVSGRTLAFGSTTGNLYASEDRGESWGCIGNNLPPVYSVRFARLG